MLFAGPPTLPFALNAVTFLGSAALVFAIRTRFHAAGGGRTSLRRDIGEGVGWLWSHRPLRALVLLLAVWNLTENAIVAVLVLYALQELALPGSAYGVLLTGLAVGGILGATFAPRLQRRLGTGTVIAITVVATVIADLGLAATRQPILALALLALVGAGAFAFNVVSVSYRQSVVPDRLQGRVNSTYRFATWGITPLGAGLGGLLAQAAGIPAVFWCAAVVLAMISLVTLPALTNARLADPVQAAPDASG